MEKRIEALRGHFIVCAYGRVGRAAVRELEAAGLPFVVVDPKEDLRERMDEDALLYLVDDPSLEPVLRRAGVERARGLLCAVDSDATNVFITLTARQMNPDLFIVARASDPGSTERLERAGADRVVSPFVSSGRHMVRMAQDPSIVDLFDEGSAPIARSPSRNDSSTWATPSRGGPWATCPGSSWPCAAPTAPSWRDPKARRPCRRTTSCSCWRPTEPHRGCDAGVAPPHRSRACRSAKSAARTRAIHPRSRP